MMRIITSHFSLLTSLNSFLPFFPSPFIVIVFLQSPFYCYFLKKENRFICVFFKSFYDDEKMCVLIFFFGFFVVLFFVLLSSLFFTLLYSSALLFFLLFFRFPFNMLFFLSYNLACMASSFPLPHTTQHTIQHNST